MENGPRAAYMSNAECVERGGGDNPDLCDSMVCCGSQGVFVETTAAECTALNHAIVDNALCVEEDDGNVVVREDERELTAAVTDAGIDDGAGGGSGADNANAADSGSTGGCSVNADVDGPIGASTLLWLFGLFVVRRRRPTRSS
jgi:MYXO-CTERM domain-containing protein